MYRRQRVEAMSELHFNWRNFWHTFCMEMLPTCLGAPLCVAWEGKQSAINRMLWPVTPIFDLFVIGGCFVPLFLGQESSATVTVRAPCVPGGGSECGATCGTWAPAPNRMLAHERAWKRSARFAPIPTKRFAGLWRALPPSQGLRSVGLPGATGRHARHQVRVLRAPGHRESAPLKRVHEVTRSQPQPCLPPPEASLKSDAARHTP